jgi:hypothetical protein
MTNTTSQMDAKTKEKLLKLLALTDSTSDGEAGNAMRAANALLKRHGLSWGDIITDRATPNLFYNKEAFDELRRRAEAQANAQSRHNSPFNANPFR